MMDKVLYDTVPVRAVDVKRQNGTISHAYPLNDRAL
jgi:hypothetical protein